MHFLQRSLNKLNGLHYTQEYLCLDKKTFQQPLHAYLMNGAHVFKDITNFHLFVGYHPVIFAFFSRDIGANEPIIDIIFSNESLQPNDPLKEKDAIAKLSLKKINQFDKNGDVILFYEGTKGSHHFISGFHQFILELNNRLYNRKTGNVFLEDNLYKQVQIAYSVPRKICLVTVGQNSLYNLFPTDLHGQINDSYIISLRHEGKACAQVETTKKIVLSEINAPAYKKVYALGKNHMQSLKERTSFEFGPPASKNFNLPLPKDALLYKELELENSFTHGIHKLLLFRIICEEKIADETGALAHIHNCYATWRYKQGISSNFLLR
jgi:hypothetical protein